MAPRPVGLLYTEPVFSNNNALQKVDGSRRLTLCRRGRATERFYGRKTMPNSPGVLETDAVNSAGADRGDRITFSVVFCLTTTTTVDHLM